MIDVKKNDIYKMQNNPAVTSMGNSWVRCKSKSHPGRIYYFNTFTGEAAWNLSEVEKEKAKKTTNIIEKSGVNMDGCPEPKDPPQDCPSQHLPFNKQFYNFQNCNMTNAYNNKTIEDSNQAALLSSYPRVPYCSHINSLSHNVSLGIPMSSGFNPNIWNIPVTQQVLLSNTMPPLVNQPQHNIDVHHDQLHVSDLRFVQATSVPIHERFEKYINISENTNDNSSTKSKIKNFATFVKTGQANRNVQGPKNDLRELIAWKRHRHDSNTDGAIEPKQHSYDSRLVCEQFSDTSDNIDTIGCHQEGISNLHNSQEADIDIVPTNKLNTSNFKNNTKHVNHEDLWYILSDVNIYINHHGFLKILMDSDEGCRLLVLDTVVAHIRNASRSNNFRRMKWARRAMSFVSCNIRAGRAIIAKDSTGAKKNFRKYILDCCLKYMKENYRIILLCNDKEVYKAKVAGFPIYTVNELKSVIHCGDTTGPIQMNIKTFQQKNAIKITIPNNEILKNHSASNGIVITSPVVEQNVQQIFNTNRTVTTFRKPVKLVSIGIQTSESNNIRKTVNVGTQTTVKVEIPKKVEVAIQTQIELKKSEQTACPRLTQTTLNSGTSERQNSGAVVKKNDIILNRNSTNQSCKKQETDKKIYKWRRRRPLSGVGNTDNSQAKGIISEKNLCDNARTENTAKKPKLVDNFQKRPDSMPTGSDTVSNQNNFGDNVILGENSMSGVISNESSKFGLESETNESMPHIVTDVQSENSKNFMFEVTSTAMEDNLKTRCDEWVSRFSQIMEEVLTQLLQKDPLPYPDSLSPPWTLHEATQCIRMKYLTDIDIVDGADKLSKILLNCSDLRGKIDVHMSPEQYMKMYSYGVYLVDSLQSVNNNSEDLQIAAESLANLLKDIQNINGDSSQNDSFADISHDIALDASSATTANAETELNELADIHDSETQLDAPINTNKQLHTKVSNSVSKYNLRSQWKRTFQNDRVVSSSATQVKFYKVQDAESTFFSSLHLRKNDNSANSIDNTSTDESRQSTVQVEKNANDPCDYSSTSDKKPQETGTQSNEPKIIRNFIKHMDYEKKIQEISAVTDDLDKSNEMLYNNEYPDDELDNNDGDENENNEEANERFDEDSQESEKDLPSAIRNNTLKNVLAKFLRTIRETFLVIYAFCEGSKNRLTGSDGVKDGDVIIRKAKETHSIIIKLCNALQSIQNRDVKETAQIISKFLKSEDINDFTFDEQDLQEYRFLIGRCLQQATTIRDTVKCIIDQDYSD